MSNSILLFSSNIVIDSKAPEAEVVSSIQIEEDNYYDVEKFSF